MEEIELEDETKNCIVCSTPINLDTDEWAATGEDYYCKTHLITDWSAL